MSSQKYYIGPEKCENYMGDWDTYQGCPVTHFGRISGDSGDIKGCRQRRMVARILRNLLKGKMIVRKQTLYGAEPIWWRWKE